MGTGLRQEELLALQWSYINLDKGELQVKLSIRRVEIISSDGTKESKTWKYGNLKNKVRKDWWSVKSNP